MSFVEDSIVKELTRAVLRSSSIESSLIDDCFANKDFSRFLIYKTGDTYIWTLSILK